MTQEYILLNDYQHLSDSEKLSFTLFGDEIKEITRFVEFNKEMFREVYAIRNVYPELLEKTNLNFLQYVLHCERILEDVDQNTMMLIDRDLHELSDNVQLPLLIRYRGNRIDFDYLWKYRGRVYSNGSTNENFMRHLFYSPCVYPNVLDSLSQESLLELVKERYSERYAKFLANFKKNGWIIEMCLGEDITMIVAEYIHTPKLI
jgi:hypothetical protein